MNRSPAQELFMNRLSTRQVVDELAHDVGDVLTVDLDLVGPHRFASLNPAEPVLGLLLRDTPRAAAGARACLERAGVTGVRVLQVDEGWLVLAMVEPDARRFTFVPPARRIEPAPTVPPWRDADPRTEPRSAFVAPARPPAPLTFDARPVDGATIANLREDAVQRWLRAQPPIRTAETDGSERELALTRRGVLARDGDVWRPTFAAMILGSDDADEFVPDAIATFYDGVTLVRTLLAGARHLTSVLGDRDIATWRDAYVNAWIHRDWTTPGEIEIDVDDGELRIENPGCLLDGTPAARRLRNPLLATLAMSLGYCPGQGVGHSRLRQSIAALGGGPCELRHGGGSVVFYAALPLAAAPVKSRPRPVPNSAPIRERVAEHTLDPAPAPKAARGTPNRCAAGSSDAVEGRDPAVPTGEVADASSIVAHLTAHGPTTAKALAAALGCSRPTISRRLAPLLEAGVVKAEAEGTSSPLQRYTAA
jgi:hypothetical protein